MMNSLPVMNLAFSEARKTTASATSSGSIQGTLIRFPAEASAISSGDPDIFWSFPYAGTITGWRILGTPSGSIQLDVWKDTYTNAMPTNTDSICNGHEPKITSAIKAEDTDLSDWSSVSFTADDVFKVYVDSCSTMTKCVLMLDVEITG